MNIIFWNVNRKRQINKYIYKLITENKTDIIILAEYCDEAEILKNDLYINGYDYEEFSAIACKKIKIFYSKELQLELCDDNSNYMSVNIKCKGYMFQLFSAHFPSMLHVQNDEREIIARELKQDINKYEKNIIVGDFNSNPFDKAIMATTCLSALPTKKIKQRKLYGKTYKMLYNPMWNFFGDFDKYPGTYYYNNSKEINFYWYMFDQVLISPGLYENFEDNSLRIIKKIDKYSLIKNDKIFENISDHLPIFFSLKEEKNGR